MTTENLDTLKKLMEYAPIDISRDDLDNEIIAGFFKLSKKERKELMDDLENLVRKELSEAGYSLVRCHSGNRIYLRIDMLDLLFEFLRQSNLTLSNSDNYAILNELINNKIYRRKLMTAYLEDLCTPIREL
ncbi:MAG: hypothetical protein ARM1_0606 [Candidatus Micrarchaeota archaeon]|nr:MAG: hypothetical protein ARM1_0606 [Candidatus Micrarchaeota archaeon]